MTSRCCTQSGSDPDSPAVRSAKKRSRSATVAIASGRKLAPDGDLLRYRDGSPAPETSNTEAALRTIAIASSALGKFFSTSCSEPSSSVRSW